jgi:hypothetical protein
MAQNSSKTRSLSATLWSLLFVVCLGLAAAHLASSVWDQTRREGSSSIESTFTPAPGRR